MVSHGFGVWSVSVVITLSLVATVGLAGRLGDGSRTHEDLGQQARSQRNSRRNAHRQPPANAPAADSDIVQPEVMGRGRHGWSHEVRRVQDSAAEIAKEHLKPSHPMMGHLSTATRASMLLLAKLRTRFAATSGQARELLQMLSNLDPHHHIARKHDEQAAADAAAQAKADEGAHYDKVTALEAALQRLEYRLQDTRGFAEEIAADAARTREARKALEEEHAAALEAAKVACDAATQAAEQRVADAVAEVNARTAEAQDLRRTLDGLTSRDSASSRWRMALMRNSELVLAAAAVAAPLLIILGYLVGHRRGAKASVSSAKKHDDLFDTSSGAGASSASQPQQHNPGVPSMGGGSVTEVRNRALHRFDGGI